MNRTERGFSLVEMAIVLGIVGLLLSGGMTILTTQQEIRKTKETIALLNEAKEALTGFAITNGRLPCPAPAVAASGTAGAGLEPTPVQAAGCASLAGVLPWATLGVSETDAWGNRITYRVTGEFTRTRPQTIFNGGCSPPSNPAFALCSQGDMTLLTTGGGGVLAATIPAVLISHGKNGNGAYTTQGTQIATGADADELDNQLTGGGTATANLSFVYKSPTATFDDLTIWLAPAILFNRMVAAGMLP